MEYLRTTFSPDTSTYEQYTLEPGVQATFPGQGMDWQEYWPFYYEGVTREATGPWEWEVKEEAGGSFSEEGKCKFFSSTEKNLAIHLHPRFSKSWIFKIEIILFIA